MQCPRCENETRVLRTTPGAAITKRRRACEVCGHRFNTSERADDQWVGTDAKTRRIVRDFMADLKDASER